MRKNERELREANAELRGEIKALREVRKSLRKVLEGTEFWPTHPTGCPCPCTEEYAAVEAWVLEALVRMHQAWWYDDPNTDPYEIARSIIEGRDV